MIETIRLYFLALLDDGDYLNDWLTHMPVWLASVVVVIGQFIAGVLGL